MGRASRTGHAHHRNRSFLHIFSFYRTISGCLSMRRSQANACRRFLIEHLLLPDIDSRGHLSLFLFAAICVPKNTSFCYFCQSLADGLLGQWLGGALTSKSKKKRMHLTLLSLRHSRRNQQPFSWLQICDS